ncbi:pimeloyl-ACP methyl ester carboxylesterase [Kordia periserrulae]|uniref:Pimeloyl-ACP methyl ester carboxylesterase n=1 Tax=Kordia periserrulae TaxID=701523 RepID=A0A2T6BVC8_9FLAO|nr:alpha/beta hydrolase [Kordia periserrulae]PTX60035.1 pimeloyl-ACP methyl ester carboxylesterase [Kordia periserrulae]
MKHNNLLLLHGALGSEAQLQPLQQLLSKDFNVHTLNFEGHGGRKSNRGFAMEYFAENVVEKLQELKISQTHIFGYSMGGYVALTLAKKHPEMVDSIVTLGTKFNWSLESAQQEVNMLNPSKIEEKVPAFAKHLQQLHHPNDWKEVLQKTADMMLALANGKRLTDDDLQQIPHKVLIGIGSLDTMVSVAESEHAAALVSNGTINILEGVKHPIEKVDMNILAAVIHDFLA